MQPSPMCKCTVLITLIALLLMTTVCICNAASIPVPEFTIKLVSHPYDVPPKTSFNPYTGQNTTIQEGYTVENVTVELTIKNQPFATYIVDNKTTSLYYNIRYKGHFEDEWKDQSRYGYLKASNGEYTVKSYPVGTWDTSLGSQVDFQVQSLIGYPTKISDGYTIFGESYHYVFTGETGSWSDTQTFTMNLPTVLGLYWEPLVTLAIAGVITLVIFVVVIVVVVVYLSKRSNVKVESSRVA